VTVLGLDPGRDKIGWALVGCDGDLFWSGICPASEVEIVLRDFSAADECREEAFVPWILERHLSSPGRCSHVAVGNGTGSRDVVALSRGLGFRTMTVDERGTTLEARALYWILHQPEWWRRCLPRSLWVPPRPLDDLAAWVIARRSLADLRENRL
jgi:hypothetical protein